MKGTNNLDSHLSGAGNDRMIEGLNSGLRWISASDGARIPYAVDGPGDKVLLLLHGGSGSYRDFEHLVPLLVRAGLQVVRPELRPHALTEIPLGADISHARIARDLKEILDALGVQTAHVAGWSHGGCVALQFAHDFSHATRTLGVFNGFAFFDHGGWFKALRFKVRSAWLALRAPRSPVIRERNARELLHMMMLGDAAQQASPEACRLYEEAAIGNMFGPQARLVRRSMANTLRFDARSWLASMTMPALVVTGTRDHVPTAFSDALAHMLPDAELARWPDGDHGILLADPEGFAARYLRFIAEHGGRP
ncbi:alpha/beta fold hydrolase [Sphingomonas sp.]|uniref:alpha/beta fold hydrolase n=1 Tax=Sphingomonas sp. TaxID=28214 RepID=UPI003D6CD1A7